MKFHWKTFWLILLPIWAVALVSMFVIPTLFPICVITVSLALIGTWVIQYQRKILETLERIEQQGIPKPGPEEIRRDLTE
ncbi:MAG: hypothetical protein MR286_04795 [Clostridiales bacterium]|nr:hypothetical protein [Clostridiales bacterium]